MSVTEFAPDLGISDSYIHNWTRAFHDDGTWAAEVVADFSDQAELKQLREENWQLCAVSHAYRNSVAT